LSLLTIIQDVADLIGISRPAAVVTSTDQQVRQLFALAKMEARELSEGFDWEALTREHSFITSAQAEQVNNPVPNDLRKFVPDTFFNRTTQRRLVGPITSQQWQILQARPVDARVYLAFRKRDGRFLITPDPPAGETIAYEYVSAFYAKSSAGAAKAAFTSDDDGTYLDEDLVKYGMIWRWKQAKGLPYAEDMETYERAIQAAKGEDGGAMALGMFSGPEDAIMRVNLPEGGFGL
jgi:hypothetical protein